jgi:hypothetical protein
VGSPEQPGIPARDGFNGFLRDLPGDRLCCHRRFACAKLDASVEASGPHDFAVRVQHRSSAALFASIASRPASVTIASAPWWDETAQLGKCFASDTNAFIFVIGTGQVICPSGTERCGAVALAHTSVIASAAKQSSLNETLDCFLASLLAMTECVVRGWPRMRRSSRHRERSEAIQLANHKAGLLRRFAPRNDGVRPPV